MLLGDVVGRRSDENKSIMLLAKLGVGQGEVDWLIALQMVAYHYLSLRNLAKAPNAVRNEGWAGQVHRHPGRAHCR